MKKPTILSAILIITAVDLALFARLTDASSSSNNDNNSDVRGGRGKRNRHRHQRERILQPPEEEFTLYYRDVEKVFIDADGKVKHVEDACEECWVAEIQHDDTGAKLMTGCIEGIPKEEFDSSGIVSGSAVLRGEGIIIEKPSSKSKIASSSSTSSNDHEDNDVFQTQDGAVSYKVADNSSFRLIVEENTSYEIIQLDESDRRHYKSRRRRRRNLMDAAVSDDADTEIDNPQGHRILEHEVVGTMEVLVLRVTAQANGITYQVTADQAQLQDDIFDDDYCLKSQYDACSHGQLKIEPSSKHVETSGIVEINISTNPASGDDAMRNAAIIEATNQYGDLESNYDLVIVCLPPGSPGDWLAYAYIYSYTSVYNDYWCQRLSALVHEIGHNIGLGHSNEGNAYYTDETGMMGYSYDYDDWPVKCFNPAKNFQLGWYEPQLATYDVTASFDDGQDETKTYVLNGMVDYDTTGSTTDKLISLHLVNEPNYFNHYYVGYNRAKGAHRETGEAIDKIVVVRKEDGSPYEYGESWKECELVVGQSCTLHNWNDSDNRVKITYVSRTSDLKDATITVASIVARPTLAPSPYPCAGSKFSLDLLTDNYGEETSWSLEEVGVGVVASVGINTYQSGTTYNIGTSDFGDNFCLKSGKDYVFIIYDSYGDGMCCASGVGEYVGKLDGVEIFRGGEFGSSESHGFTVEDDDDDPTETPTEDPTEEPTDSPTFVPSSSPTTSLAPTSAPTLSLAPTSAPTTTPTERPTGSPTASPPEACVNSAEFDCAKHSDSITKKKCFKNIRKKWGSGKRLKDMCPELCKPNLCTCVDRVEKFIIKREEEDGERTCEDINDMDPPSRKSFCKKRTDIGFTVKSICPNQCENTGSCVTDSPSASPSEFPP